MSEIIVQGGKLTINLKELTDIIKVRHDRAKKKIEELSKEEGFGTMSKIDIVYNEQGQTISTYLLNKKQAIAVGARLNNTMLMTLINKLEELENSNKIQLPQNFGEALLLAGKLEQEKEILRLENKELEKTKAYIGDKKVATALNTASQKSKENEKLKQQLDESKRYCTIKRMEMLNHGMKFKWRLLKGTGIEMNIQPIDVFDSNYGTIKAYHKDVWEETYKLTF